MFICEHFKEERIKKIFNISAAKRAKEFPNLFDLTHTPIYFYNPLNKRHDITEKQLIDTIFKSTTKGTILFIIKGDTGTSKSEFCVKLRRTLKEQKNRPLTLYKGISYPAFLKKLITFYEKRFNEDFPQKKKKNIESIILKLSTPSERISLLWLLTSEVFYKRFPKISNQKEIYAKIVEILSIGIERLAEPQDQGIKYAFIDSNVYERHLSFLNQYFANPDNFNKAFTKALYDAHDAPNIKEIIEIISEKNKKIMNNERIIIVFEDFSLDDNEGRMLFNYMLDDNPNYNITFVVAGTPEHIKELEAEDTYHDRRRLYETQYKDLSENNYVPTFEFTNPVNFIQKYLGYIKTNDESLLVYSNEYVINNNNTICKECGKCNNLNDIVLFPFNETFIKNIYDGIGSLKNRTPRKLIMIFSGLLEEYIENETPFYESQFLSDINAPKSTTRYKGSNLNFKNFIKWFGSDVELFLKLFPNEQIDEEGISTLEEEDDGTGEVIFSIPEELEELRRNIHKFISNPNNTKNEQINKIRTNIFYALDNVVQVFTKRDHQLSPISDKVTIFFKGGDYVFVNEGVPKKENQIYINIKDFSEDGLIFLLTYGYFLTEKMNDELSYFILEEPNKRLYEMFKISISKKIREWRNTLYIKVMNLDCSRKPNENIYIDDVLISMWYYLSLLSNPGEKVNFKSLQASFNNDQFKMNPSLQYIIKDLRDFKFNLENFKIISKKLKDLSHLTRVFASHGGKSLKIKSFNKGYDNISLTKYKNALFNIYKDKYFANLSFQVRLDNIYIKNFWHEIIWAFKKELEKFKVLSNSVIHGDLLQNWEKYIEIITEVFIIFDDENRKKKLLSIITEILKLQVTTSEPLKLITNLKKFKNYLDNPPDDFHILKNLAGNLITDYIPVVYSSQDSDKIIFAIQLLYFFNCELTKRVLEFINNFYLDYKSPSIEVDLELKEELNEVLNNFEETEEGAVLDKEKIEVLQEENKSNQEVISKEIYKNLEEFNDILKNDELNQKLKNLLPDIRRCCLKYYILRYNFESINEILDPTKIDSSIKNFLDIIANIPDNVLKKSKISFSSLENGLNDFVNKKFDNIDQRIEDLKALNNVLQEFEANEIEDLKMLADKVKNFPVNFEGDIKDALKEEDVFKNFEEKYKIIDLEIKASFDNEVISLNNENARKFLKDIYYENIEKKIADIDENLLKNIKMSKFKHVLFIIFKNPETNEA